MNTPKVSVIMPVYNGELYLQEAIESILGQAFTDFEFIVINDGSTDSTPEILQGFDDPRIQIIDNGRNLGLVASLNRGLNVARGEYIARQDADDISLPVRLERQIEFLESHPQVALLGCAYQVIDAQGTTSYLGEFPTDNDEIQRELLRNTCFCHGSVVIRRTALEQVGGYRPEFVQAEDYDLWLRLAEHFQMANLQDVLYLLRKSEGSRSERNRREMLRLAALAVEQAIERRLGENASGREMRLLARHHLKAACASYEEEEVTLAQQSFERAITADPSLLEDIISVGDLMVAYARTFHIPDEFAFVRKIADSLPPDGESVVRLRIRLLGYVHMCNAFTSYAKGDLAQARRSIELGVRCDPSWLANRGVISIFLESFIGTRAMNLMRKAKRRATNLMRLHKSMV